MHPICGKPLVQWVVEAAKRARSLDEVLVATDDPRIAEAVKGFARVAMTRSDTRRARTGWRRPRSRTTAIL